MIRLLKRTSPLKYGKRAKIQQRCIVNVDDRDASACGFSSGRVYYRQGDFEKGPGLFKKHVAISSFFQRPINYFFQCLQPATNIV